MSRQARNSNPVIEDDDDDEGFSSTKWVPASQRSNKPLEEQNLQELEGTMLADNRDLTDDVLNLRRITEDTKGIAGQTLVTLKEQGEKITKVHDKAVKMDQELEKGEHLLNKLGGMFTMPWKPKKGKKITGPTIVSNSKDSSAADAASRAALGLGGKQRAGAAPPEATEEMSAMQRYEMEKKFQDQVLDEVSDGLDALKNMAQEMGSEMDKQDKQIDDLSGDVGELNNRIKQGNQRARRLLGRK